MERMQTDVCVRGRRALKNLLRPQEAGSCKLAAGSFFERMTDVCPAFISELTGRA